MCFPHCCRYQRAHTRLLAFKLQQAAAVNPDLYLPEVTLLCQNMTEGFKKRNIAAAVAAAE